MAASEPDGAEDNLKDDGQSRGLEQTDAPARDSNETRSPSSTSVESDRSASGSPDEASQRNSENDTLQREADPQLITGDIEPFDASTVAMKMGKSASDEAIAMMKHAGAEQSDSSARAGEQPPTRPVASEEGVPGTGEKAKSLGRDAEGSGKVDAGYKAEPAQPVAGGKAESSGINAAGTREKDEGPVAFAAATADKSEGSAESTRAKMHATAGGATHHHFHVLDTVLDQPVPIPKRFKQTMIFDVLLGFGLLLVVGGFTTGLMRIYITHMAKQSIYQHNYKAAITILRRNPIPDFFNGFGSDPNELLNQALYLDAMDKLEADPEDQAALSQLSKISAGSRFFTKAQEILQEKSPASSIQLEGGAREHHIVSPEELEAAGKNARPAPRRLQE